MDEPTTTTVPETLWSIFPSQIDDGWAALVGALIAGLVALLVLARQNRANLKTLVASQEGQARLDRVAREHQASILQESENAKNEEERKVLVFALSAELTTLSTRLRKHGSLRRMLIAIAESGENLPDIDISKMIGGYKTPIYDANIGRIGLLGPSVAGDVVTVYSYFQVDTDKLTEIKTADPLQTLAFLKGIDKAANDSFEDCFHVHKRLMHLVAVGDDPGPLFFERQRRDAKDQI